MKEIDAQTIANLLQQHSTPTITVLADPTCGCGTKLDNGYCRSGDCSVDAPVEVFGCDSCGSCCNPNRCVSSVACPLCGSQTGNLCLDGRGGLTGYHEARWQLVKERYGTYYR